MDNDEKHYVYEIRGQKDALLYIGLTKSSQWPTRISRHKKHARQLENFETSSLIMAANGVENLSFSVVKEFDSRPIAHDYEVELIRRLDPFGNTYSK